MPCIQSSSDGEGPGTTECLLLPQRQILGTNVCWVRRRGYYFLLLDSNKWCQKKVRRSGYSDIQNADNEGINQPWSMTVSCGQTLFHTEGKGLGHGHRATCHPGI